jgi:hypothetical protein
MTTPYASATSGSKARADTTGAVICDLQCRSPRQ